MTNPLFEINAGIVSVTKQGFLLEEVQALFHADEDKGKAFFHKQTAYIFMAYSKDSPFYDILIEDRKGIVSREVFKNADQWKAIEKNKNIVSLIAKLSMIQITPKERLLEGVNSKIEEYLEFMRNNKITNANHEDIASQIKNSNELLKLRDTIEKQVLEQKNSRDVGGGKKKRYED